MSPKPRLVGESSALPPKFNILLRGLKTVFVDRQIPYSLRHPTDRMLSVLGSKRRMVRTSTARMWARRLTHDEQIIRCIQEENEYTPIGYEIHDQDTVIDIGANIGAFTVMAAHAASSGRVIAFEPVAANHELLVENVRMNGLTNCTLRKQAVLAGRQRATIFLDGKSSGGHSISLNQNQQVGSEEVEGLGLADIFDEFKIEFVDFMKIDCEGAEWQILLESSPDLLRKIGRIAMEYHVKSRDAKHQEVEVLIKFLVSVGFQIDDWTDAVGSHQGLLFASRKK